MSIFAISDLHLCFGTPDKSMEDFGPLWENYQEKIEKKWKELISKNDLVLIPGDISWASKLEDALIDLAWIDSLPGTKLIIKGNHDYWWSSISKLRDSLPHSIKALQYDAFDFNDASIGGTRMWDTMEYNFDQYIDFRKIKNPTYTIKKDQDSEKIFHREQERLTMSLLKLNKNAKYRIAMTHYPPIGANLKETSTSKILEKFDIDICVFGHLHSLKPSLSLFGKRDETSYILTSADYINFTPIKIL